MDFRFGDAEDAFRRRVHTFFEEEYPRDILEKQANGRRLTKQDSVRSQKALHAKGWAAPGWPQQYGGPGWSATERYIFAEEMGLAGAPSVSPMGLLYVAPVIYTFGSEAQKARWLPDILSADALWCQGYSEPGAGSDLSSLSTRAERHGDGYRVNGSKIWTGYAHWADWIFCLVRTRDTGKKREGISFLCMEMSTPGISVRPIVSIDGEHHLNEVFFVDVDVPAANLIGEEGKGWDYAKYLLGHERTSYAHISRKKAQIARLKDIALSTADGERSMMDNPQFAMKLADVEIALLALEVTTLRTLGSLEAGASPGNESSIIKVLATENAQSIDELYIELAGLAGAPFVPKRYESDWVHSIGSLPAYGVPAMASYLYQRAQTIYGGTTEIQKDIVAKTVLGL